MRLTSWWDSPRWHAYERAYGDAVGTRAARLAAATFQTRVVDLRPDEPRLWHGVRRSFHSLIHKVQRDHVVSLFDDTTNQRDVAGAMAAFRLLHADVAGRSTRSSATWDMMTDWIGGGNAILLCATDGDLGAWRLAFAFFVVDGPWAYYFSSASRAKNVNQALVWHAMLALKDRGVETLEMGWQGESGHEKGQNIEFFRRGFGGTDVSANTERAA